MMRTPKNILVAGLIVTAAAYHLGNLLAPPIEGIEEIPDRRLAADFRSSVEDRDPSFRFLKQLGGLLRYKSGQVYEWVYANGKDPYLELFPRGDFPPQRPELAKIRPKVRTVFEYLRGKGVNPVLLAIPNKVALQRERLPAQLPCPSPFLTCPELKTADTSYSAYEKEYLDFLDSAPNAGPNLLEVYRNEARQRPDVPVIGPWEYHWTNYGLAVTLRELAPYLGARSEPEILSVGVQQFPKGHLVGMLRIPDYFFRTAKEFSALEDRHEAQVPERPQRWPRVILAGTSFSWGESRDTPVGQLRRWGIEVIPFARPAAGHDGPFQMMKDAGFEFEVGDTLVWELPTCCGGSDNGPIYLPPVKPRTTRPLTLSER